MISVSVTLHLGRIPAEKPPLGYLLNSSAFSEKQKPFRTPLPTAQQLGTCPLLQPEQPTQPEPCAEPRKTDGSARPSPAQHAPGQRELASAELSRKKCRQHLSLLAELRGLKMTALEKATGDVVFKFEPFVLHVLCQELQDAQLLHSVAVSSGFRNSGITVGKGGKIMMAVRSTHCLEVPLSHKGKLMVSEEYIDFLIHVANQKMEENIRRIDRFYKSLEVALKTAISTNSSPSEETGSRSRYLHRRKRRAAQERDAHTSPKDHGEELEPEGDTESILGVFAEMTI